MKLCRYLLALVPALLFAACGDDDETTGPPATTATTTTTDTGSGGSATGTGGGGGGGSAPFDVATGTWQLSNASNTADTISHDGAMAITSGGVVWIAFAEPLPEPDDMDQDIFTTARASSNFETAAALTSDSAVQNAFPALAADADTLHLVWNGPPGGDNDIFYASHEGAWSSPVDLTSATEGSPARTDYRPDLAIGPGGNGYVAYLSEEPSGPASIRVVTLSGGAPSGSPVTVIDGSSDGCYSVAVAVDDDGDAHVVAECGPMFEESIHYATNRTGSWASEVLAGGAGEQHTGPDITVGPDGASVHVVWQAWQTCTGGTCADIHYVRSAGGAFGNVAPVLTTADESESSPLIAVDSFGRPLVVFSRANGDGFFDIFVTNSEDGTSFVSEVNITPGTDDSDQWMPYDVTFHPATGLPHLTYTEILASTDPLDTEVMHAELIP
ncbi:MAG: hypothetical protein JRI23_25940 [Deltaproteobacteria bacterium]|jgi:hypothetical protein|nr:hypothetical protein [Deltaproteobacteria bacterium]MBW2535470.1 hypothetical protein [Deltaproteobacteria bacterium]